MYGLLRARRERRRQDEDNRARGIPVPSDADGPFKSTLRFFLENTSIPGIAHLHVRPFVGAKIFWIVLFALCFFLGTYLSKNLLNDYLKYAVVVQAESEVLTDRQWPSITLCMNSPIQWTNESKNKWPVDVLRTLENALEKYNKNEYEANENPSSKTEAILLAKLSEYSEEERLQYFAFPLKKMVPFCKFNSEDCVGEKFWTLHHNVYWGTCATFNSGIPPVKSLYSNKQAVIAAFVRLYRNESFPVLSRHHGAIFQLHEAGTAPLLDIYRVIPIGPGKFSRFGVYEKKIQRQPPPYPSACVDSDDPNIQKMSVHYSQRTPYLYSFEACLDGCNRDASYRAFNCVDPASPFRTGDRLCNPYTERIGGGSECSRCPVTCRETTYSIRLYQFDEGWTEVKCWKDFLESVNIPAYTAESTAWNKKNMMGFDVSFASAIIDKSNEEPKIQIADLIGALGGNIGLWVGISIISMFELVEFLIMFIYKCLTKKKSANTTTEIAN